MKIVIDIPENVITAIQNGEDYRYDIHTAIAQGIPHDERPQGEWIRKVDEAGFISHICSECGAEIEVEDPKDDKFCFNCGAEMQKGGAE